MFFPGGQILEYVIARNKTQKYFTAVKEAGYKMVEVSDNLIDISLETKIGLIKIAREAFFLIDRTKSDLTNYDRSWMHPFG